MAVPIEREVKLLAPEEFELPDMNGVVAGVSCGSARRLELDAVYFDSAIDALHVSLSLHGTRLRESPGLGWGDCVGVRICHSL